MIDKHFVDAEVGNLLGGTKEKGEKEKGEEECR
jgi:hypothetical protein